MLLLWKWSCLLVTVLSAAEAGPGADTRVNNATPDRDQDSVNGTNCCNICRIDQTRVRQDIETWLDGKLSNLEHPITRRFEELTGLLQDVGRDVRSLGSRGGAGGAGGAIPRLEELDRNLLNISEQILARVTKLDEAESRKCVPNTSTNKSPDSDILTQITNIANKITDPDYKEPTILKSIENIINNRLDSMEVRINESLNALRNNRNNGINESIEKNISDKIIEMTKQISDKIDSAIKESNISESIENINQKLAALENIPGIEQQIQNLMNNISEKLQPSVPITNQGSTSQAGTMTATEPGDRASSGWCSLGALSSVPRRDDVWQSNLVPAEDELDRAVVRLTGCSYRALPAERYVALPAGAVFDGRRLEWRGAVRARDAAYIGLWWPAHGYGFNIGEDGNTNTKMYNWSPRTELRRRYTPRVLEPGNYVPFYIRIENNILTFGKECEREPIFTHNITIRRGDLVRMSFQPKSSYGAKYLHRCPARLAAASGRSGP